MQLVARASHQYTSQVCGITPEYCMSVNVEFQRHLQLLYSFASMHTITPTAPHVLSLPGIGGSGFYCMEAPSTRSALPKKKSYSAEEVARKQEQLHDFIERKMAEVTIQVVMVPMMVMLLVMAGACDPWCPIGHTAIHRGVF